MNKKTWKSGDVLPPELLNALMNLSFEKDDDEVGNLPLPPNYGKKVQVFQTENNAVNLSSASSGFAIVEHYGSTTSLQPVTITIDGIGDSGAKMILLIIRGTSYPVTVSLPQSIDSRKTIALKGGSSVLLTYYSYSGGLYWKYYELETNPVAVIDTGWKSFAPGGVSTDFVKFATLTIPKGYSAIIMVKGTGHSEYAVTSGNSGVVVDYTVQAVDANNNEETCKMSVLKVNDTGHFLPGTTQDPDARDDEFSGSLVFPPANTQADRSVDLKIKSTSSAMSITASFRALLYKSALDSTLLT